MLIAVLDKNLIVPFITIFGSLWFLIATWPKMLPYDRLEVSDVCPGWQVS